MAQTITFVITQDCNLRCKYCYMVDKNKDNNMSADVGEQAIDYFLTHKELYTADAVILEFIGGEPFLEIDLMDHLTDYFKIRAYELGHKWFEMYRISISTNGLLYSSEKVQKYIKKNYSKLSVGISLDGNKEKNDLQRVYPSGKGSYDDIIKNIKLWQKQFPGAHTKVTIGHDDLPYVKDSIIHLWNLGMKVVPANVVFENVWQEGDDAIFYEQLKELADYIIDNEMWYEYNTTLFTQGIGSPLEEEELKRNSCGTGSMVAVDSKGNLYPCIRFMEYSLENQKGYVTGNIYDGVNRDKVRPFYFLNTKNANDDECLKCPIASGCQWCTGYNYDQSKDASIFQREKSICKMHKARVRANNYLWSRLSREKKVSLKRGKTLPRNLFIILEDSSINFCNYRNDRTGSKKIGRDILKRAAEYCLENFVRPVLLHSNDTDFSKDIQKIFTGLDYINIYPADNVENCTERDIIVYDAQSIEFKSFGANSCILNISEAELKELSYLCCKAMKQFKRVNINLLYDLDSLNLDLYYEQLCKINLELIEYFEKKDIRQVNVLTDDLFSGKRNNCSFGVENFALAPDGGIYICPAFYFSKKNVIFQSVENLKSFADKEDYNILQNDICKNCDIHHCKFCVYQNKKNTGESRVPSAAQCKITQTERKATYELYTLLMENHMEEWCINKIAEGKYEDPVVLHANGLKSLLNFSYNVAEK